MDMMEEFFCLFHRLAELFYRVSWMKLMQILKGNGTDWRERRLISKLYLCQGVQIQLHQGEFRSVKFGGGVRRGCCLSEMLFNLHSECIIKEALERLGTSKWEEK
jgi:hypothetical protein